MTYQKNNNNQKHVCVGLMLKQLQKKSIILINEQKQKKIKQIKKSFKHYFVSLLKVTNPNKRSK